MELETISVIMHGGPFDGENVDIHRAYTQELPEKIELACKFEEYRLTPEGVYEWVNPNRNPS